MNLADIEISFDYGGDDEAEKREILRNVQTILSTPVGTCPLYRDFGVDPTVLDYPMDTAEALYTQVVIDAVEKWEPRVRVTEVHFSANVDGSMRTRVVIASG